MKKGRFLGLLGLGVLSFAAGMYFQRISGDRKSKLEAPLVENRVQVPLSNGGFETQKIGERGAVLETSRPSWEEEYKKLVDLIRAPASDDLSIRIALKALFSNDPLRTWRSLLALRATTSPSKYTNLIEQATLARCPFLGTEYRKEVFLWEDRNGIARQIALQGGSASDKLLPKASAQELRNNVFDCISISRIGGHWQSTAEFIASSSGVTKERQTALLNRAVASWAQEDPESAYYWASEQENATSLTSAFAIIAQKTALTSPAIAQAAYEKLNDERSRMDVVGTLLCMSPDPAVLKSLASNDQAVRSIIRLADLIQH